MTNKRVSKKVVTAVTGEQFNDALSAYATADARTMQIVAQMDVAITKIREKHSEELEQLQKAKESALEITQCYCTENKAILFDKKKSMETPHGMVGFRTGTPKLKLKKGFNWTVVLELLKAKLPAYVRKIEEPDKASLLLDREKEEVKLLLPDVGVLVDQDEAFFIELKKEEVTV